VESRGGDRQAAYQPNLKLLMASSFMDASFLFVFGFCRLRDEQEHPPELNPAQLRCTFLLRTSLLSKRRLSTGSRCCIRSWYQEAEKQFFAVLSDDPHPAIAHWGVAMSLWHQLWEEPDPTTLRRELAKSQKAPR
jgi:hypothetical protein